tara:strand:+ start:1680 stop:2378 length:699 start_codon:yes stop_codon:yes gene_type:complete
MNNNQKISILLSAYNDGKYLPYAIESILNQTYENFEFLIRNDGSTDETFEILDRYRQIDKRIKIFNDSNNVGLTKSLNLLLKEAKGDLIARQDTDDFSFKERLEIQLDYLLSGDIDACTTRAVVKQTFKITPNKSYYLPKHFVMKIKNPYIHGSLLIKKEVMKKLGGYDEKFYYAQDYKLMSDLIRNGYILKIIKTPLYVLNQKNNISTNFSEEQRYFADCVKKNIIPERIN